MKLSIGIVGLPNVGKSTLFNALLKKSPFAEASEGQDSRAKIANYPFTTIDPNIGIVEVPDERLPVLAKIVKTNKIVPAVVEFYDIAGLVRGASKGEGLGNKFLSHIREVATIVHVVRLFEDGNVIHVSNKINPIDDIQTIEQELIFADLETLSKQHTPKMNASKDEIKAYEVFQRVKKEMNQGLPARKLELTDEEKESLQPLNLLTLKPVLYVFNVSEKQIENREETEKQIEEIFSAIPSGVKRVEAIVPLRGRSLSNTNERDSSTTLGMTNYTYLFLNAKLENDVLAFDEAEQKEYLKQYHLEETGLNRLIKKAYENLGLISFLTAGEIEARAWTIQRGTTAPQAAGVIHTDFEKHFIKADIVKYENFVRLNGWNGSREAGKVQIVGRDYNIQDGDVVEFKVGV